jgi:pyruvate/2-oxoglutarate dehydrogenase complex dihydrolipoamide dehydrogenase (E3) component
MVDQEIYVVVVLGGGAGGVPAAIRASQLGSKGPSTGRSKGGAKWISD